MANSQELPGGHPMALHDRLLRLPNRLNTPTFWQLQQGTKREIIKMPTRDTIDGNPM